MIDENDLVGVSDQLDVKTLKIAYSNGVFPWPSGQGEPIPWFCPKRRAILEYSRLHISQSLTKFIKKTEMVHTFDRSFSKVIGHCQSAREETWITDDLLKAYCDLHKAGFAHSVEIWEDKSHRNLVGGLYGVFIQGVFSAESMFYLQSNASKLAIIRLMEHLHSHGIAWMDIQVMTPHMEKLGARLVSRPDFLKRLQQAPAQTQAKVF